jgi:predicted nucleotidyltransferase
VREKVERHVSGREVKYDEARWTLLEGLRDRAVEVQRSLPVDSLVYGSVARGDVHPGSDVDIVLLDPATSFEVELALEGVGHPVDRSITVASPGSVPKANIDLDDGTHVGWPLLTPRERESNFYRFGGSLDALGSGPRDRVPGVSKRLLLIEPTDLGHIESSVVGSEVDAAKVLGLPLDVVSERVRVLGRRDSVGRTGIFRSVPVGEGATFEQVLDALVDSNPAIRRQLRYRGRR